MILAVDPQRPDPAALERGAALLRAGQLVAFPTETVYGLGANALDPAAVARIFAAKGRPADDPLIVHVGALDDVPALVAVLPPVARRLAARFWPGPLTLVLPRGPAVPLTVTAGLDFVAVRMPAHPVALGLIRAAGVPVAGAQRQPLHPPQPHPRRRCGRRSRRPRAADPRRRPDHARRRIDRARPDGGPAARVAPRRPTLEQLREALPDLAPPAASGEEMPGARRSPARTLEHYSPRATLVALDGPDRDRTLAALAAEAGAALHAGRRVGLLLTDEDRATLGGLLANPAPLWPRSAWPPTSRGRRGASPALRDLDQAGVDCIFCRAPEPAGLGLALRDRMRRAAGGALRRIDSEAQLGQALLIAP